MTPTLADVLPSVGAALGLAVRGPATIELPPSRHAVVVLADGLGEEQLARRGGHAPFLRGLRGSGHRVLRCGYPTTTATSMGSFGTGRLPGAHGLVGMDVLDPERDVVFSELSWDSAVDPRRWQPGSTVFEDLLAAGADVVRIGPAHFDGSGLTEAALRGGRFVAAAQLAQRVDAAVAALAAASRPTLVYLYWGEIDKIGHAHGCDSWQWGQQLELLDAELSRLATRLPRGALLVVTADHGMVDVPMHRRWDLAHEPDLTAGLRHVAGEPRSRHLFCHPGAQDDVAAAWRAVLGADAEVATGAEITERGWLGEVEPWVRPRIGDLVVSAVTDIAVVDSRTTRPELLALIGQHGAATSAEELVPLLWCPSGG